MGALQSRSAAGPRLSKFWHSATEPCGGGRGYTLRAANHVPAVCRRLEGCSAALDARNARVCVCVYSARIAGQTMTVSTVPLDSS